MASFSHLEPYTSNFNFIDFKIPFSNLTFSQLIIDLNYIIIRLKPENRNISQENVIIIAITQMHNYSGDYNHCTFLPHFICGDNTHSSENITSKYTETDTTSSYFFLFRFERSFPELVFLANFETKKTKLRQKPEK